MLFRRWCLRFQVNVWVMSYFVANDFPYFPYHTHTHTHARTCTHTHTPTHTHTHREVGRSRWRCHSGSDGAPQPGHPHPHIWLPVTRTTPTDETRMRTNNLHTVTVTSCDIMWYCSNSETVSHDFIVTGSSCVTIVWLVGYVQWHSSELWWKSSFHHSSQWNYKRREGKREEGEREEGEGRKGEMEEGWKEGWKWEEGLDGERERN